MEADDQSWPIPQEAAPRQIAPPDMFAHMFEENHGDLRRRGLSQINVIAESSASGLALGPALGTAVLLAAMYVSYMLSILRSFPDAMPADASVAAEQLADVQWGSVVLVTLAYGILTFLGVRWMERRTPIQSVVFELMAVYNCVQVLLNAYEAIAILLEAGARNFKLESVPISVVGPLIWLQYHCRQMELLDSFFMILRKKFEAVSFFHMYFRVLNMWGWFFGFHYACIGQTLFPALVTSVAQALQYLYFSLALFGIRSVPFFRKAPIAEIQIASSVVCMIHNLFMAVSGQLPLGLAMLHLFVVFNGAVLYTDFHFRETHPNREESEKAGLPSERVTFSFDSAGWLYVYQFGVAAFLQEHLMPRPDGAPDPSTFPEALGFSGSSAGALTALLLASGTSVPDVFEHVLAQYKVCSRKPSMMPVCAEEALRKYQFPGAFKVIAGRLRILITRVLFRPPFFMGEVVDDFPDNESAIQLLLASCHIPIVFGILPKKVSGKYYYDGLMWSSLFVPWRGAKKDHIVKVSGIGGVLSDIRPPFIPPWWCLLPPPVRVLRGLYWQGYMDALLWFRTEPQPQLDACFCGSRRELSGSPASAASSSSSSGSARLRAGASESVNSELQKWKLATGLLKQPPPKLAKALALSDPSGETVRTLLKDFYDARSHSLHVSALVCSVALLPLGAFTPQIRSTVLFLVLAAAVSFAWHAGEDKKVAR
eukprot:TRINITY_DN107058_c0_g1_i1.p1 TRINITY_DN107058_c0_g1~~TRINITY_DN107058_c0_g1_i1.p1  ORF type:complete len:729 (-),score=133.62 TRINITY_DN107058_c0_g1_i1:96-2225(-)